VYTLPLIKESA